MRLRPIALFVLIGLSAAACTSGSGQSSDTPSPSPSSVATSIHSTPTSSAPVTTSSSSTVPTTGPNVRPGEKPPTLPSLATHDNEAGALLFGQFWFRALDWAYATTDASLLRMYFTEQCSDCILAAKVFDGVAAKGEHFQGGRLAFHRSSVAPNDGRNGATGAVDVTIGQSPIKTITKAGRVVSSGPSVEQITFRLWLRWTGSRWTVVQKGHVT